MIYSLRLGVKLESRLWRGREGGRKERKRRKERRRYGCVLDWYY